MVILLHVVPLILLKQDEVFNLNSRDTSMFNLGDCSDQQLLDILLKKGINTSLNQIKNPQRKSITPVAGLRVNIVFTFTFMPLLIFRVKRKRKPFK